MSEPTSDNPRMLHIRCPNCKHDYEVGAARLDESMTCRVCKVSFLIEDQFIVNDDDNAVDGLDDNELQEIEGKQFSSDTHGYRFTIPDKGWLRSSQEVERERGADLRIQHNHLGDITFRVEPWEGNLDQLFDYMRDQAGAEFFDFGVRGHAESTIAGCPARFFEADGTSHGVRFRVRCYGFIHNGLAHRVQARITPPKRYPELHKQLGIVFRTFRFKAEPEAPQPVVEDNSAPELEGNVFESEAYGYEFAVPAEDWTVAPTESRTKKTDIQIERVNCGVIRTTVEPFKGDFHDRLIKLEDHYKEEFGTFFQIISRKDMTVAGYPAMRMEFEGIRDDEGQIVMLTCFVQGGKLFQVLGLCDPTKSKALQEQYDRALKTFRFKKGHQSAKIVEIEQKRELPDEIQDMLRRADRELSEMMASKFMLATGGTVVVFIVMWVLMGTFLYALGLTLVIGLVGWLTVYFQVESAGRRLIDSKYREPIEEILKAEGFTRRDLKTFISRNYQRLKDCW